MAVVAQLVRALDCGSKCRGFEPRRSPHLPSNVPCDPSVGVAHSYPNSVSYILTRYRTPA